MLDIRIQFWILEWAHQHSCSSRVDNPVQILQLLNQTREFQGDTMARPLGFSSSSSGSIYEPTTLVLFRSSFSLSATS